MSKLNKFSTHTTFYRYLMTLSLRFVHFDFIFFNISMLELNFVKQKWNLFFCLVKDMFPLFVTRRCHQFWLQTYFKRSFMFQHLYKLQPEKRKRRHLLIITTFLKSNCLVCCNWYRIYKLTKISYNNWWWYKG